MGKLYPEMRLNEKPQTDCGRCVRHISRALGSDNLQATVCTSRNESRMSATLQSACEGPTIVGKLTTSNFGYSLQVSRQQLSTPAKRLS